MYYFFRFSGCVQCWDLKSQRLEKSVDIFDSKEHPILWLGTFVNDDMENILVQARFATKVHIYDSQFANCKKTLQIQQAVPHFCKGDIFQEKIILPVGESHCGIFVASSNTLKTIENDHKETGNLMSLKLSSVYLFLGFESGTLKMCNSQTFECVKIVNVTHSVTSIACDENYVVTSNQEDYIICHEIPSLNLGKIQVMLAFTIWKN